MTARYDRIGRTYATTRQPDPRIAARIDVALGSARTVVNVGAGTGSYEPFPARKVVAVEPSAVMIAQRPPGSAPVVQATAEALPFPDGAFDAALAVLTIHHWSDVEAGVAELHRVAGRIVVFTFDADAQRRYWLFDEYLPDVADIELQCTITPARLAELLGGAAVTAHVCVVAPARGLPRSARACGHLDPRVARRHGRPAGARSGSTHRRMARAPRGPAHAR